MGLWWWWPEDGNDASLRTQYLDFFKEAGITEIYYYGYYDMVSNSTTRQNLHTFITEANKREMRVAILYDEKDICNAGNTLISELLDAYTNYMTEYPEDNLFGYHFDIEGFTSNKDYCENFIGGLSVLRDAGIPIGVDVNCTKWNDSTVSLNGVNGMYNIIAANIDYMTLMSYRTNAEKIFSVGAIPLAACKKYGCDVLFGVETDNANEGVGVDFHDKTKKELYKQIDLVFNYLKEANLDIGYGMSIHQNRSFYKLQGDLPDPNATTTIGGGEVSGGEIERKVLYENHDLNYQEFIQGDSYVIYSNPELAKALRDDFAENGLIYGSRGEYYKITIEVMTSSSTYCYPCLFDHTNKWDFWAGSTGHTKDDYPNGTTIRKGVLNTEISYIHDLYNSKEEKYGEFTNEKDGILLYIEERSTTLTLTGLTIEVYRLTGYTPITTEPQDVSEEESSNILLGDAYEDGQVDMKDVLAMRRYIAGFPADTLFNIVNADVNKDQTIDMKDVLYLRKYIAGVETI